jgi:hypothetical protein
LCLDAGNLLSYPGSGNTWYDLTKNPNLNDATLLNSPTFSTLNKGCIQGFSTSNPTQWIRINNGSLSNLQISDNTFTWEMAFKILENTSSGRIDLMGYNGYNPYWGYVMCLNALRPMLLWQNPENSTFKQINPDGVQLIVDSWYRLVVVMDSGSLSFFLNGSLYQNMGVQSPIADHIGSALHIGGLMFSSNYNLKGLVSNVNIYNRALSATEIQNNYLATKGRYGL